MAENISIVKPEVLPEDPIKKEKEDLQTALELFLEDKASGLGDLLAEYSELEEDTQTVRISLPVEILQEYGYTPALLMPADYTSHLQWSAQREGPKWIALPDTPQTITAIFPDIHKRILEKETSIQEKTRRGDIEAQLAQLGLQTSQRSTPALEKAFEAICKDKPVNFERLEAQILHLGIREQGYRFFHNKKDSVTLAKKSQQQ